MKFVRVGICILTSFAVLSFGGVEAWGQATLEIGAAVLFVFWAVVVTRREQLEVRWNWLYLPLLGLGAFGVMQYALGLSVYPYLTKIEVLKWGAYILVFFLALESFRTKGHLKQLVWFVLGLGFAVSLFAIVQHFTFNGKLYWFVSVPDGAAPFGPFVNTNHFAGFVELVAPLGLALLSFPSRRREREHVILLLLFTIVPVGAVFLSASRAGIIVLVLEFALLAFLSRVHQMRKKQLLRVTAIGLLAGGMILWLGVTRALERFELLAHEGVSRELRVAMYEDTWRIFRDHPWTGSGLGTLIAVYPRYASFYNGTTVDHAHNDFLELLADTGLIGGLCGVFFIGVLFRQGFVNFRIAIGGAERALIVGPLVACLGLLLHSLVDFNLHIPSNALIFLLLACMSVTEPVCQRHGPPQKVKRAKIDPNGWLFASPKLGMFGGQHRSDE
jgi:O-antigen ligase